MNPIADVLRRAAARVERGWCQHKYARDAQGECRSPHDPDAVQWCMYGALHAETHIDERERSNPTETCVHGYAYSESCPACDEPPRTEADKQLDYELEELGRISHRLIHGGQGRTARSTRDSGMWAGLAFLGLSIGIVLWFLGRWLFA
jgi:hypothetical protein